MNLFSLIVEFVSEYKFLSVTILVLTIVVIDKIISSKKDRRSMAETESNLKEITWELVGYFFHVKEITEDKILLQIEGFPKQWFVKKGEMEKLRVTGFWEEHSTYKIINYNGELSVIAVMSNMQPLEFGLFVQGFRVKL